MNTARISTPGASSPAASSRSFSPRRTKREARSRLTPGAVAPLKARSGLRVDLAELACGRLDRLFGLHLAARRIRVHVDDDVLVPCLGGLLARRAREAHVTTPAARGPERRHHRIDVPHLVLLPLRRRRYRETLLHDDPLLVVGRGVRPTQEF